MDIQIAKDQIVPIIKKYNISKASFFGSIVTGKMNEYSDIDLLIDMPEGSSLLDLMRVKVSLEERLKRKVDLVQYKAIKLRLRDEILSHQVPIY